MTKAPKRPRDPAQLAKLIVDIVTGEVEEREPASKAEAGKLGGKRRAELTPKDRRTEIARQGAKARWKAET